MIGTKFAKPLAPDTLTRTVMRTETREEKHLVGYPVERTETHTVQEPVYTTITADDGEKVQVISGYINKEVTETVQDIEYREETRTIAVEVPEQEKYPNPAPNTYSRYREAAQWCNANGAMMVDCQPTAEYPNGYYEVQVIPEPSLEELREEKLDVLNATFEGVRGSAWVMSSLGFKADANETANTNVDGLIKSMTARNEATTMFCDYDNMYHSVTLENLQTLQLEIIQNGQALYAQKWAMRDAINAAKTADEIEAVNIVFTMMDFTV